MCARFTTFALVIAAGAVPVVCSAASSDVPDLSKSPRSRANAVRALSLMDLSPTKPLVRPYDQVGIAPRQEKLPTEVDYKPFANGPVGSVGVICRPISHALNSTPVGATSEGQPGSESQSLGANLAYTFR